MAYISVDHSKFEPAASEIDSYVEYMKKKMGEADGDVAAMHSNWEGSDYTHFINQWDKVTNGESTYTQMVKSLESYAKYLRFAAGKYKDAQANAVNRANRLYW